MKLRHRLLAAGWVLAAASLPAFSQVLDKPTLYRLDKTSTFQRGCFAPCMCPMLESAALGGTFRLTLASVGNVFDFYDVTGVRFKYQRSTGEIVDVTGSGTYAVSTISDDQRMELTLVVGTDPPTLYKSGDVPGGAAFPKIDIAISINGGYCHDTVMTLHARPARRLYTDPLDLRWDVDPMNVDKRSDVVYGSLRTLRETTGAFDVATWGCATDANATGSAPFAGAPAPNDGFWFLERAMTDVYADGDAWQVGSPDPGIALSPGTCP